MISLKLLTDHFSKDSNLLGKHRKTVEWLSATQLWKRELAFFQKLLDEYAPDFSDVEDKKKIDHFQNLIIYYNNELVDSMIKKLRYNEEQLADILQKKVDSKVEYFKDHEELMNELETFNKVFSEYKEDLFHFIEKVMH